MTLRHMALSDVDRLALDDERAAGLLRMDEDAFRLFYEQTARPLWAYLARATGDRQAADDLLQEAYFRLLRTTTTFASEEHRRSYLFRVAVNLVRDRHRRPAREVPLPEGDEAGHPHEDGAAARLAAHRDVDRALASLRPRDRDLLWLAYALGLSHVEMAHTLGVKPASVKLLLYRARTRLATLLGRPRAPRTESDR